MENWFLHYNFLQGIMGSPVVGSTSSCREHSPVVQTPVPTVVESTLQLSRPRYLQLLKHPQFSGVLKEPTVVWTTYSCREHLQLSRAPSVIQSTPSCRDHLHLSKVPPVVKNTSSCREHLQLSKVPPVVQSTSSCPKYLQLSKVPPVVESTPSCREHLHLSKVPPAVESDFCQTGSVITRQISAKLSLTKPAGENAPELNCSCSATRKYLSASP